MEDLSGKSDQDKFLDRWSFFDLQTKIKYKAEEAGIKVVTVNAAHTSQRCSKCGHIDKGNRDGCIFKCLECGFEADADYNASQNIATKEIDKLIKEYMGSAKGKRT